MSKNKEKHVVILIAFYNVKALGIRYLESALEKKGYKVVTVYYKGFNSLHPQKTTDTELKLLCDKISNIDPFLIGLSVMSSMYLETVDKVINAITAKFDIPITCGGAYASMFPEYFLNQGVGFAIRTDGEHAICQLADALKNHMDYTNIPSLCYRSGNKNVINDVGNICVDIDDYGIPTVIGKNSYYINNNRIKKGDPQSNTMSYEIIASRGCPFTCSYCCCSNLRQLFPKNTPYVRIRSVKSVIDELVVAKSNLKRLVFIHFYDEIFPNSMEWVDNFVTEYKKRIGLPFTIWTHPKMIDTAILKKLVSVGLSEVIMGIQSGSPDLRKNIFHRYETQEDIINAVKKIRESGVKWSTYDFMLQHPFETIEDLKKTYDLVMKFEPPFELQLHGLNFLPGTDIVSMAIERSLISKDKMDAIIYAPMEEQFNAYWKLENELESQLWYKLIFCLQFDSLRNRVQLYASNPFNYQKEIDNCYRLGKGLKKFRYLCKKNNLALSGGIKKSAVYKRRSKRDIEKLSKKEA